MSNVLVKIKNLFLRQSENKKAFIFFVFLISLVFFRVIINQQTFFSNILGQPLSTGSSYYHGPKMFWELDAGVLMHFELPQTIYWAQELRKGHFAFWNPHQGNGQPLSGNISSGIYNPIKLLLFGLFPYSKTFDFYFLLRFIIAGFGAYLFLKKIKLSQQSALLGGIAYMFSAYFTLWITHVGFATDMITPYILLAIENLIESSKFREVLFLGMALGVMLLSQNPEPVIIVTIFYLIYFLFRYFQKTHNKKTIFAFLFSLIIALAISAPMLWDNALFFSQGPNGHTSEWVAQHHLGHSNPVVQLYRLLHLPVAPTLFLEMTLVNGIHENNIVDTYIGTFILLLAIAGWSFKKNNKHWSWAMFFSGTLLFFILMWLNIPLISWLGRLPILDKVNFFRYIGIFHLSLAVLAAIGFENIKNQAVSLKKFWSAILLIIIPIMGLLLFSSDFRDDYKISFNQIDLGKIAFYLKQFPIVIQFIVNWLLQNPYFYETIIFGLTFSIGLLFLFLWRKKYYTAIFIVLILELVLYIPKTRDVSNFQDPYRDPPFVNFLKSQPEINSYRIFPVGRTLMSLVSTGYQLNDMGMFDVVWLRSYLKFIKPFFDNGFIGDPSEMYAFGSVDKFNSKSFSPIFNLASVKYIISEKPLPQNNPYKLIYDKEVKIYENKDVLPLARIETDDGQISSSVIITKREPNLVALNVEASPKGMLVLGETNYPGWRVFVDGEEKEIVTVHEMFRGVYLGKGVHEVVFKYWPFTINTFKAIIYNK